MTRTATKTIAKAPINTPVESTADKKPLAEKKIVKRVKVRKVEPVTPVTPLVDTPSEMTVTPGGTRKRREVNAETVNDELTALCDTIEQEIERIRESKRGSAATPTPAGNIKFLRSTLKRTKNIQNDVRRVARKKRPARKGNNNSGFKKDVLISDELAKFLGRKSGTQMCRADCASGLHAYIKSHNLQNPKDRREIQADSKLAKLLDYNPKTDGVLKYTNMQKLIQKHFINNTQ
jgi:chromatin remodeling complex protein RSC6